MDHIVMPSKITKDTSDVKVSKTKNTKKNVESDDEEPQPVLKTTKGKKVVDSSDDELKPTKPTKKTEVVEEDSDEEVDSESESSDSEDEAVEKKTKEKKTKESFEELTKKLEALRGDIKDVNKEISELEKQLKSREKVRNDYERQCNAIVKVLSKTHTDEVNKAIKSKPKRKGNVNGGFNKEQPVPEVLAKFLGLEEGTEMTRPKVYSAFSNKCKEMGLKDGKNTTLNEEAVRLLGLPKSDVGKVIPFTGGQSFLSTLYPKKTLVSSSASDNLAVEEDEEEE